MVKIQEYERKKKIMKYNYYNILNYKFDILYN